VLDKIPCTKFDILLHDDSIVLKLE
jgi:hypothetical protein